jgi:biopolymer transport protein ExbD
MKNKNLNIENENQQLRAIAPVLFSISKKDVFYVHDNYFAELDNKVELMCLIKKIDSFEVPEGYFTILNTAVNELTLQSKAENFSVPENYFQNFPQKVQELIQPSAKGVFDSPQNYFENLPRLVQQRIYEQNNKPRFAFPAPAKYSLAFATACVFLFVFIRGFYFEEKKSKSIPTIVANKSETKENVEPINIEVKESAKQIIESENSQEELHYVLDEINNEDLENAIAAQPKVNIEQDELYNYLLESGIDETAITDAI